MLTIASNETLLPRALYAGVVAVEEGAASYFWNIAEYEGRWDLIEDSLRN